MPVNSERNLKSTAGSRMIPSLVKNTVGDAAKVLNSRGGIKNLYGVSLYRNAGYLMLSSATTAFLGFIFWALGARLYPAEIVGLASAAISAMNLLGRLSTIGLGSGLIRYLPVSGPDSRFLMNGALTTCGLLSLVFSAVFLTGLDIWSPRLLFLREHPIYFAAFVVFTAGTTLAGILDAAFIAKQQARICFIQALVSSLIRVGLLVIFARLFATFGIFASQGLGFVVACLLGVMFFLPRMEAGYRFFPSFKQKLLNNLMSFSFANYTTEVLWVAPSLVLPIMVVTLLGGEQNAYFYVAWNMVSLLGAVGSSISLSLFAEGSHNAKELQIQMRRSLKFVLVILVPTVLLLMVLGEKLLLIFGRAYSESASHLLWVLIPSCLPLSINWVYIAKKRVEREMKPAMILTGLIGTLTLGMSYVLLPRLGIFGAGLAWTSTHAIAAAVVLPRLLRETSEERTEIDMGSSNES